MMRTETQESISAWAEHVFGPAGSNARTVGRANEEMAELIRAATSDRPIHELVEEAADVVIVLYRLAARNGYSLDAAIDAKMALNRIRKWTKDGTGHGYHVRADKGEAR
ncbi:MazG-like family protein [Nitrosovibrio sp. Nv4]|uniref:MazG-like family protein n=1 Tax=Nitrosovibrio sp. Nv4 TaxID=1945880 RepID=UPI000BC9A6AE|nr:dATP/dGTP pyrophosphohydrolase domain-containing protein [Nitrosovibrio sp. Nv4]SOD42303.1 MazG-like family protein [Nitrosovibrio sp. Nv4]